MNTSSTRSHTVQEVVSSLQVKTTLGLMILLLVSTFMTTPADAHTVLNSAQVSGACGMDRYSTHNSSQIYASTEEVVDPSWGDCYAVQACVKWYTGSTWTGRCSTSYRSFAAVSAPHRAYWHSEHAGKRYGGSWKYSPKINHG